MKDPDRLTRREFLAKIPDAAIRSGVFLSGTGAVCMIADNFISNTVVQAGVLSGGFKAILKTAPVAGYWASAESGAAGCTACHLPDEAIKGKSFDHKGVVKCLLCARECLIPAGERGACKARFNDGGKLKSLVYGRPITVHVDPIEKKPLYHFLPGSSAYSLATSGCPLECAFCQNWEISQAKPEDYNGKIIPPHAVVKAAAHKKAPVIAFTYNEPAVFTEYLLDIAEQARKQNIRSVLISCGYMNEAPLSDMCDVLDAIKIDLKGYSPEFYSRVCKAKLDPVLRSIRQIAGRGVHLELVNLVVPTLNDSKKMMTELAKWISGELGPDVPIHFTRFHPAYLMKNLPPTPRSTLEAAYETAKSEGIRYPYVGNIPGHPGNHTYCYNCGKIVIERVGFFITGNNLTKERCKYCDTEIAGVFK